MKISGEAAQVWELVVAPHLDFQAVPRLACSPRPCPCVILVSLVIFILKSTCLPAYK